MSERWSEITDNLKRTLPSGIFKVWIAPLKAHVSDTGLHLVAPNSFVANWLESKMLPALREAAAPVLGMESASVNISITARPSLQNTTVTKENRIRKTAGPTSLRKEATTAGQCLQGILPIPATMPSFATTWRYSFADFIIGPSNNMAAAAARDVSDTSGTVHTLFINSAAGLGKTHLAHAVGKAIADTHSSTRVAYLTAEDFASRYVASIHNLEQFKARFNDLDVLLLEDVHFFQKKEKMQEMALTIIKNLQARGGKVIFTSSFSPRELQNVDSGLVSRFCSGILTDIVRPTEDMRRDILKHKAKTFQVLLPDNVCELLAYRLDGDVRQLESCLNSLIFKARMLHSTPDINLALEILNQYEHIPCVPDLPTIIRLVCESYGLEERQLRSRSRRKEYVLGRNTVYYLARKHTELTLEEIGEHFHRRHSSVIKGITSVERELSRESIAGHQIARAVGLIERNAGLGT